MAGTISIEYSNDDENTMIVPKYVLIATGSKPKSIPGLPVDGEIILHSAEALQLEDLPKSMIIIGGGIIGIEWASLLQDSDVKVTIVESQKSILASEDAEVRKEIEKSLKKRGVKILVNTFLHPDEVQVEDSAVTITVEQNEEIIKLSSDKLLVSVGREANIQEIGLTNT